MVTLLAALAALLLLYWLWRGWNTPAVETKKPDDTYRAPLYKAQVAYEGIISVSTQSEAKAAIIDKNVLALVTGQNGFKWLVFRCPCGCGQIRRISVSKSVRPAWHLELKSGKASLSPSVDLKDECHAHFFLKESVALVISSDFL